MMRENAYIYEITWAEINFGSEFFHTEVFHESSEAYAFMGQLESKRSQSTVRVGAVIALRKVVEATDNSREFTDEPVGKVRSMHTL